MSEKLRITSIRFRNYKAFRDYSISLNPFNVLVGPNNAGKSPFWVRLEFYQREYDVPVQEILSWLEGRARHSVRAGLCRRPHQQTRTRSFQAVARMGLRALPASYSRVTGRFGRMLLSVVTLDCDSGLNRHGLNF